MKILITGAAGTVGVETLKKLLLYYPNAQIIAFDIPSKKNYRRLKPFREKVKLIFGNLLNDNDLEKIGKDIDFVIHLAAIIPPLADQKPQLAYNVNVKGTEKLINYLEKFSPNAKFLYTSSISVYGDRLENPYIKVGDPLKPSLGDEYAKTKILAEQIVSSSKLSWTIFRLTAIFGIKNHKISKIMFNMPLQTPMEIATAEDTGNALAKSLMFWDKLEGKIFNLSGGKKCRITYKEFLERSFKIYGLGKLRFPITAFATRNFHCAYYSDSDVLEEILHFRNDTIESYFQKVKKSLNPIIVFLTKIFSPLVQWVLLRKSEPYRALLKGEKEKIIRFFGEILRRPQLQY